VRVRIVLEVRNNDDSDLVHGSVYIPGSINKVVQFLAQL